jgi:hypothetical protein
MLPAKAKFSYTVLFDIKKTNTPQQGVAKKQPFEHSIAAGLNLRGGSREWKVKSRKDAGASPESALAHLVRATDWCRPDKA